MKKAIIGMIMSMVIALGIGGFVTTINYYENRLAEADSKYRRDIDGVENLKDKEYDEMHHPLFLVDYLLVLFLHQIICSERET